mmetsp:Transcript_65333/g.188161  ORF Transcript_65333/g.188161 Transcript_65333/m.188161 type:complete len:251 (+) Transcript_65333:1782-2534(+)
MMMLMMNSHNPAAAPDFFDMPEREKSSPMPSLIFLAFSTFTGGTLPSLMWVLKSFKLCRNFSGAFIIFTEPFQDGSFALPFLSTSTAGSNPASKCIAASQTKSTPPGGLLKAFNSWKSFLSKTSRAASAVFTNGTAFSRSASQDVRCAETSAAILAQFAASTLAFSDSACTFAFSRPTSSAKTSAACAFSATITAFSLRTSSKALTSSCVCRNFVRPFESRSFWSSKASTFWPTIVVYNLINSKKLFGVV